MKEGGRIMDMTYEQAQQIITLLQQILAQLNQIERETSSIAVRV